MIIISSLRNPQRLKRLFSFIKPLKFSKGCFSDAKLIFSVLLCMVFISCEESFLHSAKDLGVSFNSALKNNFVGKSVAISDDGKIVAFASRNGYKHLYLKDGAKGGEVSVFEKNQDGWNVKGSPIYGEITALGGNKFGSDVCLSKNGKRIAIAAEPGYVEVYDWDNTEWKLAGQRIDDKLITAVSKNYKSLKIGSNIELSGDGNTLVIAGSQSSYGIIFIFKWNGGLWNLIDNPILGDAFSENIGSDMVLSNDGKILFATNNSYYNDQGDRQKALKGFRIEPKKGITEIKDIPEVIVAKSLGKNYISANGDGNIFCLLTIPSKGVSKVKTFNKVNEKWTSDFPILELNTEPIDSKGDIEISDDGNTLVVGYSGFEEDKGKVEVYKKESDGWVKSHQTLEGEHGKSLLGHSSGAGFGHTIDLSTDGSFLIIGSPYNSKNGFRSGQINAYQLN